MKRHIIQPRNNWQTKVEELGFGFHTTNLPYWDESVYYSFSISEIEEIERVTLELWDLCLEAVQFVIDEKMYDKFKIPEWMNPQIEKSWYEDHPSIYGRFDFGYDGKNLKNVRVQCRYAYFTI
jgi:glutathionylspermidine synthase